MSREKLAQIGWFIGLWFAGVLTITIIALLIKFWLKA